MSCKIGSRSILNFVNFKDSKIAAWSDYGYQINQLAERGTLADNSASNKTSIAQIGKAFASSEEQGWSRLRHLGADFVYGKLKQN